MAKGNGYEVELKELEFSSEQFDEQIPLFRSRQIGFGLTRTNNSLKDQRKKLPPIPLRFDEKKEKKKYSNESLLNNSYPRFDEKEKRRFNEKQWTNLVHPRLEFPLLTQSNEQMRRFLLFQKTKLISNPVRWKSNIHLLNKPKLDFPMSPTDAYKCYRSELTNFELTEIFGFQEVYYLGHRCDKIDANELKDYEDEDGFYCERAKDHLMYRYEICCRLGKGSFGIVVRCYDHQMKQFIACKILRRKKRFRKQGLVEISILHHLNSLNNPHKSFIVQMKDHFVFREHICITFELLGINLYELIQLNNNQGFPYGLVKQFSISLLKSLQLLSEESIIHCDLKPENILLLKKGSSLIKLIDFGSGCFQSSRIYTYIQSRYYRAPEIILGIAYTTSIDIWSFGCIIVELLTGETLFDGQDEFEQMSMFIQLIGLPPVSLLERGKRSQLFFDKSGKSKMCCELKNDRNELMKEVCRRSDEDFVDFVLQCLEWNPSSRLTAKEGLTHQTFVEKRC